jgi:hypothetical protein
MLMNLTPHKMNRNHNVLSLKGLHKLYTPAARFGRRSLGVMAIVMDAQVCKCLKLLAAQMAPIQYFTGVESCVTYKCVHVRKCLLAVFLDAFVDLQVYI